MKINEILAHRSNYTAKTFRKIEYIVVHYTGNINDSARSNCNYYASANKNASAHYFVDENNIYRSVPDMSVAWSVGIGNRKEPYIRMPMYGKITNSNSISVEICGGKTSYEPSLKTKNNAKNLIIYLMDKYSVSINNVYRHYDVTGKCCPGWLIEESKWTNFKSFIMEDSTMTYDQFKEYMKKYEEEKAMEQAGDWSKNYYAYVENSSIMDSSRPKSPVTREELATVVYRIMTKK